MCFAVKGDLNQNQIVELENHYDLGESLNDSLKDLLLQGTQDKTRVID